MKKIALYFAVFGVLTLLLISCKQREGGKTSTQIEQVEPLLVFCEEPNLRLVLNFQACYPEIQMEPILYTPRSIEDFIMKYGNPDIILSHDYYDGSKIIIDLIEKDIMLEITDLYEEDDTILQKNYFEGVLDSCKLKGSVYALPLTISTPYLIIRDEAWMNSAFSQLPEDYTREELLEAIETELDQNATEGYLAFPGGMWYLSPDILFRNSGMLDPNHWKTSMEMVDEEKLHQIVRVAGKMFDNYEENITNMYGYFENGRINPTILNGNYLATCWDSAPQMGLLYSQSVYKDQIGQDIHVVWLPTEDEERKYAAMIRDMGMIGKDSQQKELAYEVLRMMMDMKPMVWQQPNAYDQNYCSVNREAAGQMLECIETTGAEQFKPVQVDKRIPFQVDKEPLNDALKMQLEEYLDRVCVSYRYLELEGYDKISEILTRYCYENDYIPLEFEGCYKEIMNVVQNMD